MLPLSFYLVQKGILTNDRFKATKEKGGLNTPVVPPGRNKGFHICGGCKGTPGVRENRGLALSFLIHTDKEIDKKRHPKKTPKKEETSEEPTRCEKQVTCRYFVLGPPPKKKERWLCTNKKPTQKRFIPRRTHWNCVSYF